MKKTEYDRAKELLNKLEKIINGGKGSGNFGHSGRPGEVGGSASSGSEMSSKGATDTDPRENLQTAMTSVYKIRGAHERVEDGRLVTDESLANNKEYKEALKKAEQAVDEVRKIDEQSDDWETKRKVAKIKRMEEKIGKKALVTTDDLTGSYSMDFMDKDGKEYFYESRNEEVRERGTGKEYLSPAVEKAMADGGWGNPYELTGAQIKKKLKDYGINTDGLSVSKGRGGYETAWYIKGSGIKTDLKGVERITKSKLEDISRDERSGEILLGGNTYVFVDDTDRWEH